VARISRSCVCAMLMAVGLAVSGCSSALRLTGLGGFDDEPVVANPVLANSNVANSNVANSNVANSNVANPNAANSSVANPVVANPGVANPASQKMQAGDQINVTVYNEASLSGKYAIDPGGFVTIPLAGKLRAAGLTPSELADLLVKKFRGEYLNNPKVTVALARA
jgi:protein involved in polysaccharide export with SLBB domain